MSKRPYTKASDWIPIIQEWQGSGLNKKLFCQQKNINYKVFYRWYNQLTGDAALLIPRIDKKASSSFIPVEVSSAAQAANNGELSCVLRLHPKLQLYIPLKAVNVDFLQTLFESVGVKPC